MRAQQASLLAQIGALLGGFVDERQALVEGMVGGLQAALAGGHEALAGRVMAVAGSADDCIQALQVGSERGGGRRLHTGAAGGF